MKKTKLSKIVVLVLSLALLLGSAIGIAVSAEGDETAQTYDIAYMNASYGERVQIVMAIDAPVAEAEAGNVVVKYSYGDYSDLEATYDSSLNVTIDEVTYPVFYTRGISPKDLGEDIIAEAHVKGADSYTPVEYNLSVAEYLYNLLYAQGKISAEDGTVDGNKKELYIAALNYAAKAQQSLYNDKLTDGETARVLVTERSYVYATVATVNGTAAKEILLPGKTGEVTLTATADAPSGITGWTVTTYAEDGTATTTNVMSNTVSITGHTVITPYADPNLITFDNLSGTVSLPLSWNGVNRIQQHTTSGATELNIESLSGDAVLTPDTKVFGIHPVDIDNTSDNNVSVFEMEFDTCTWSATASEIIYWRQVSDNSENSTTTGTNLVQLVIRQYGDGKIGVRVINGVSNAQTAYITTDLTDSFVLKVEYFWNGTMNVSINGTLLHDAHSVPVLNGGCQKIWYQHNSGNTIHLDDIKLENTYIAPAAE